MEFLILFVVCGGVLVVGCVGLLIGSVTLRAAVALTNRFLGPAKPPDLFGQWDDWDSDEPAPKARKGADRVVPEPGLVLGMVVTFAVGAAGVVGYVVLALIMGQVFDINGPDEGVALVLVFLLELPFTGVVLTFVLTLLLPTTLSRAALVAFLQHAIFIVGGGGVGALATVAWYALGW